MTGRLLLHVDYEAENGGKVLLNENGFETVVLLGRKFTEDIEYGYVDYEPSHDIVIKGFATYSEIKQWILDNYGMKVIC